MPRRFKEDIQTETENEILMAKRKLSQKNKEKIKEKYSDTSSSG